MNVQFLALLGLFLFLDASTSLRAEQTEQRTWRLKIEANQSYLAFGTDNEEDTAIAFICKLGQGLVEVLIGETSGALKPNHAMTASLTAGRVTSKVSGKTLPNEEAGVPSFRGAQPVSEPLFAALSKTPVLVMAVGPWHQEVPLQNIGNKADRFSGTCRKR
jgi:hypothetical protein